VQGLSYEQVAEICGCAVGTVKSRVNRARATLKRVLLGEGEPAKVAGKRPRPGQPSVLEADRHRPARAQPSP
jgi:RNA polymerase sigma-70 factor (ECF subfamily)